MRATAVSLEIREVSVLCGANRVLDHVSESCFAHQAARHPCGAVDKFCAALCPIAEFVNGQRIDASAASVSRLHDGHMLTRARARGVSSGPQRRTNYKKICQMERGHHAR